MIDQHLVHDDQDRPFRLFKWRFENEIGEGRVARIFVVRNLETGELCVDKMYDKREVRREFSLDDIEMAVQKIDREINILQQRNCPFLLSLVQASRTKGQFTSSRHSPRSGLFKW